MSEVVHMNSEDNDDIVNYPNRDKLLSFRKKLLKETGDKIVFCEQVEHLLLKDSFTEIEINNF